MEETVKPVKKPSGCLKAFGNMLTFGSLLFIAFCIYMIFYSEERMDERRAEYTASTAEYEEALEAYNADSVHMKAEYQRIEEAIHRAEEKGDSALAESLSDSLMLYSEPLFEPRGAIGFNIAGGFFVLFAACALVPLLIGIVILLYCRHRNRKYKRYLNE